MINNKIRNSQLTKQSSIGTINEEDEEDTVLISQFMDQSKIMQQSFQRKSIIKPQSVSPHPYPLDQSQIKQSQQLKAQGSFMLYKDFTKNMKLQMNLKKFKNSFLTIFNKKQREEMQKLSGQATEIFALLDDKIKDSLVVKEQLMLLQFKKQFGNDDQKCLLNFFKLDVVLKELQDIQSKYDKLKTEVDEDIILNKLKDDIKFFQEKCFEFNSAKKVNDIDTEKLRKNYSVLDDENKVLKEVLHNTKTKLMKIEWEHEKLQEKYQKEKQQLKISQENLKELGLQQSQLSNQTPSNNKKMRPKSQSSTYKNQNYQLDKELRNTIKTISNYESQNSIEYINDGKKNTYLENSIKRSNKNLNQQKSSEVLMNSRQTLNSFQYDDNELKKLFIQCIKDIEQEINKRSVLKEDGLTVSSGNPNGGMSNSTKLDRIELIQRFILNKRFMTIVKTKIFDEQCCLNQNCLYNIKKYQEQETQMTDVDDINFTTNYSQSQIQQTEEKIYQRNYEDSYNTDPQIVVVKSKTAQPQCRKQIKQNNKNQTQNHFTYIDPEQYLKKITCQKDDPIIYQNIKKTEDCINQRNRRFQKMNSYQRELNINFDRRISEMITTTDTQFDDIQYKNQIIYKQGKVYYGKEKFSKDALKKSLGDYKHNSSSFI